MTDVVRGGLPETRSFISTMEVRSEGRTVVGIAVPFDQPTQVRDFVTGPYTEVFRHGAFARTISERGPAKVKVLPLHDTQKMPLGRAHSLIEQPDGLHAELVISKTRAGDEALELIRDGVLDSMSIGFIPITSRTAKDGTVERAEVKLHEISLVPFPAYDGAKIAGIRSADVVQMAAVLRSDTDLSTTARAAMAEMLDVFSRATVDETAVVEIVETIAEDDAARAAEYLALLRMKHEHDAQRYRLTA